MYFSTKIRILISSQDFDSKKWACDGLAYLTLDPDIKEALTNDKASLKAMYELTKVHLVKIKS
jgi:hypothetical protein